MGDPNGAKPADAGKRDPNGAKPADAGKRDPTNTAGDRQPAARVATLFASPGAVLVILPALVIAAGVVVLLLGRRATRDTAETMARHQLVAQADAVKADVAFALDQADPVLSMMKSLADVVRPTPDAMSRLRDIVFNRPGIANVAISFPVGVTWGSYHDRKTDEVFVFESRIEGNQTTRSNYGVKDGQVAMLATQVDSYDPRTRAHYQVAVDAKKRVWMPPRVLSSSGKTALTVSEPVYGEDGELSAVLTIDFQVAELSEFIRKSPLEGARNVMFTTDGTILAYPAVTLPEVATKEHRLLRHEDFHDPALEGLFTAIGTATPTQQKFMRIEATDGNKYLAAVTSIGNNRGGSATPTDWYLATLVPERTLFGAMQRLGRDSIIASGAALAIAMGVALMFAWNILRMRRAVGAAREQARSAEARAKQLGSYRLVARLGAGGMGEVWRAEHQLLARKAAIKLVRPDVLRDSQHAPLIQERFRREAQTLASMTSRHTIAIYDYGVTDNGTFFYVMELLDGLDLAQLIREYGPQPAARVIQIIRQACQSLGEAHDAGLLHRDIKPANLVLCRAADEVDIIKVLDFGIVHNIADPIERQPASSTVDAKLPLESSGERLTTEGAVIGTPGYIPPEQATAGPIDPRGDLYALGCVAWYLLVGEEVYPGTTEEEVLRAHVFNPIPSLRGKMRGWLPVELEQLITKCLAKKPEERPENARALAKALAAIEIPEEHQWTDTHAQMWWSSLELPKTSSSEAETVDNDARLLVPNREATRAPGSEPGKEPGGPGPTGGSDARTIEARPSVRPL
ncbi:MAG TPA: protein kinase [Kofleriaceae bacterium]|nr:protein kinase [Kofleriaceae bacterium]